VLTARQSALLTAGDTPLDAFLGGYRAGLLLAAGLVALGGVAAYVGLRRRTAGRHARQYASGTGALGPGPTGRGPAGRDGPGGPACLSRVVCGNQSRKAARSRAGLIAPGPAGMESKELSKRTSSSRLVGSSAAWRGVNPASAGSSMSSQRFS
jgi:hypothetical protein